MAQRRFWHVLHPWDVLVSESEFIENRTTTMTTRVFDRFARPRWAGAVVLAVAGIASGAVAAASLQPDDRPPAGSSSTPGGEVAQPATPEYQVNDKGLTYGVGSYHADADEWPDLLLVEATNGREGYVERRLLDEVTGANVSSPEEAVAWQQQMDAASWDQRPIPVYLADGKTVIGEFEISRSSAIGP